MAVNETQATVPVQAPRTGKPVISDRARHERRLGLMLSAPAFVVMVLVTAYPLLYAVFLSLYNYRLTDPTEQAREQQRVTVALVRRGGPGSTRRRLPRQVVVVVGAPVRDARQRGDGARIRS